MTGPGIFSYSTTPANNVNSNTGITWDEGMAPALVNNSARQNMADTRSAFNDLIWFKYGKGDLDYSPVYVGPTQFKIAGADVSSVYHVNRRVRAVGISTGTIQGSINTVAFSTDTVVTVTWDSGSLANEALTISLGQVPVTGKPVPAESVALGALTVNTVTTTHMALSGGYSVSAGSVGTNYFIDSTANICGKRLWLIWNSGDGFAEVVIASNGTIIVVASSNALGNANAFDTTNSISSNSGVGLALITSAGNAYIQTKSSGFTGVVSIGISTAR
jgi:hypothetical protein